MSNFDPCQKTLIQNPLLFRKDSFDGCISIDKEINLSVFLFPIIILAIGIFILISLIYHFSPEKRKKRSSQQAHVLKKKASNDSIVEPNRDLEKSEYIRIVKTRLTQPKYVEDWERFSQVTCRVIKAFVSNCGEEVSLNVDDQVRIMMVFEEDWASGTNLETGLTGIFPMGCLSLKTDELCRMESSETVIEKGVEVGGGDLDGGGDHCVDRISVLRDLPMPRTESDEFREFIKNYHLRRLK